MADELRNKRVAAFSIAIGRALGRSDREIRITATAVFLEDVDVASNSLIEAAEIKTALNESYDGTGFPHGLEGDEIPLGARILRLALAFDEAVRADSSSLALSISNGKEQIRRGSGTLFDPKIVRAFLALPDSVWTELIQQLS